MSDKPNVDDLIKQAEQMMRLVQREYEGLRKLRNNDLAKRSGELADIRSRLDKLEKELRHRDIEIVHDAPALLQ